MIEGIEKYYGEIANSIEGIVPEGWDTAWMGAIVYSDHVFYYAEYITSNKNTPISFATGRPARKAFDAIRELFKASGKPVWCSAVFVLHRDGKFNMKWNYDDCDEHGFACIVDLDYKAEIEVLRRVKEKKA